MVNLFSVDCASIDCDRNNIKKKGGRGGVAKEPPLEAFFLNLYYLFSKFCSNMLKNALKVLTPCAYCLI